MDENPVLRSGVIQPMAVCVGHWSVPASFLRGAFQIALLLCGLHGTATRLAGDCVGPSLSGGETPEFGIALSWVVADSQGKASVDVEFSPSCQVDADVSAVQFDVRFGGPVVEVTAVPGSAALDAGKSVWTANPEPGVERVLIAGLNQNPLPGGIIATLTVQMGPETPPASYPLSIENVLGAACAGNPVLVPASSGGVIVGGEGVAAPVVLGVGNAASYEQGAVAPGEIVVIGGTWLGAEETATLQLTSDGLAAMRRLRETQVLFDGYPVPLVYTTREQVSAVVPYAVYGKAQTSLQVEYQGIRSAPFVLPVAQTVPGVFTLDLSGSGQGAIAHHEDGTINGPENPAPRGSIVLIYATGEGQTDPSGLDGLIVGASELRRPLLEVTVSIGGQRADVIYAGSAGDQIAGLLQVNARVPESVSPGDAVPVTISVGGVSSQAGVTMAVE